MMKSSEVLQDRIEIRRQKTTEAKIRLIEVLHQYGQISDAEYPEALRFAKAVIQ